MPNSLRLAEEPLPERPLKREQEPLLRVKEEEEEERGLIGRLRRSHHVSQEVLARLLPPVKPGTVAEPAPAATDFQETQEEPRGRQRRRAIIKFETEPPAKRYKRRMKVEPEEAPERPGKRKRQEAEPGPRTRPSRGRATFASTGLELSIRQKRSIAELPANFTEEWSAQVTHLIADTFRRTAKMMCAICRGVAIVQPGYIAACRKAGMLLDVEPFLLRDAVCEAAFARKRNLSEGYSVAAALQRAQSHGPLLRGISVYCFASVIEKDDVALLVAAAGGKLLTRFPNAPDDSSVLLLAERAVSSELETKRRSLHAVYDVELLREAACTQELRRNAYRLR